MRKWLALLAFVPVVAWGQVENCKTPDAEHAYGVIAESMRAQYEEGVTRQEAEFALTMMGTDRVTKRVFEAGVAYTHDAGDAFTIEAASDVMRQACVSAATKY